MINGDDSAHDHTTMNTHAMNDNAHDRDENWPDDLLAYEYDPMIIGGGDVHVLLLFNIVIVIVLMHLL